MKPCFYIKTHLSIHFRSVTQWCLTFWDPMDCRTPGFPIHHQLPELAQTHVHWVSDAIKTISSSVVLFSSCLQSFPASVSFPMSWLFASGGQSIELQHQSFPWIFRTDFLWIDWFDLLAVQGNLKSLIQHHTLKASILRHLAFFIVQLSHPYMTTGKTIALIIWTFVGKVMSLLFNTLFRFVVAFLPRSKHLLISWLQSSLTVILEPKKIKSVTASTFPPPICHEVMWLNFVIFHIYHIYLKRGRKTLWLLTGQANLIIGSNRC